MERLDDNRPAGLDKRVLFAAILIIIGGLILASNFDIIPYNIERYIFSWKMLLIVIGIISLASRQSVVTGVILIGIGILLYVESNKSTVIWFGIGIFLTVLILDFFLRGFLLATKSHFSPLFGIGGVLIILFYILTVRQWSVKRKDIQELSLIKSANYQLIGYTFFFIASWWLCENFSTRFSDALTKVNPLSPMNVIIYLLLGWLFIFLSHKQLAKK